MHREKSPGLRGKQRKRLHATRAMKRKQSPQERGNKEKLLPVPPADLPSAEDSLSPKRKLLAQNL